MTNRIIEGSGARSDYTKTDGDHPALRPGMDVHEHSYVSTKMGKRN